MGSLATTYVKENLKDSPLAPDVFTMQRRERRRPSSEFVVARDSQGNPVSCYGDSVWDYGAYATSVTSSSKLYFDNVPHQYRDDLRWVVFALDRICESGRSGTVTPATLYTQLAVLTRASLYCAKHNTSLLNYLADPEHIINSLSLLGVTYSRVLPGILRSLRSQQRQTGIVVRTSRSLTAAFTKIGKSSLEDIRQRPVIPSRLLFVHIQYCLAQISDYMTIGQQLERFYQTRLVLGSRAKELNLENQIDKFCQRKKHSSLKEYVLRKCGKIDQHKFGSHITHIQQCAKNIIHAFSGMREAECLALDYNPIQNIERNGQRVHRLLGNTTKYVGKKKSAMWVTSEHVLPAIECLQSITRCVRHCQERQDYMRPVKEDINAMPLFIPFLNGTAFRQKQWINDPERIPSFGNSNFILQMASDTQNTNMIADEDYAELVSIDPLRDWSEEGFPVGSLWPLTSHQFRRSIAVYGANSGLISLPALKRQYKHLCEDISYYYGNGSENAKNIFDLGKNHIGLEYSRTKPEADFLAFVKNIMSTPGELKGSRGRFHEMERNKENFSIVRLHQYKDKTIRDFKSGRRAYKETPVGGCESVEPCTKKLTGTFSTCFACEKGTIVGDKVKNVMKLQTKFVESLQPNTPEYRAEADELEVLIAMERSFEHGRT